MQRHGDMELVHTTFGTSDRLASLEEITGAMSIGLFTRASIPNQRPQATKRVGYKMERDTCFDRARLEIFYSKELCLSTFLRVGYAQSNTPRNFHASYSSGR